MRFRGILVRPLAEQGDNDMRFIDPAGVEFEGFRYPLLANFDYQRPLGYAVITRHLDGSLSAEGEITEADPAAIMASSPRLAVGIAVHAEDILDGVRGRVVTSCRLNAVGLTARHSDPGQPPIEEVGES